ncbi:MAG: hypothetical protein QOC99_450 [Acidobacteriota bacterium]|jgi:uncharacterized damage-inducible protein DinB|nr:hypothetical protein [Acidobacteriota bacterium]
MSLSEPLAAELKYEATTTRKMLERVPQDKLAWKPHEKSMTLGRLAGHIAELPSLLTPALTTDELDFASGNFKPFDPTSVPELLEKFDKTVEGAVELLKDQTDEHLKQPWRLRRGEQVLFEMPRVAVVRSMALSHVIHHRGQLSVYLRMLDVPLPSVYGPTADEPAF